MILDESATCNEKTQKYYFVM